MEAPCNPKRRSARTLEDIVDNFRLVEFRKEFVMKSILGVEDEVKHDGWKGTTGVSTRRARNRTPGAYLSAPCR